MEKKYREFIQKNFLILDSSTQRPVPFVLNPVQSKYYNMLLEDYPKMEGVREIVLKARQEWVSSLVLALFTVDFLLSPYSISICISHRKDATELLFKKVRFYIDSFCEKMGYNKDTFLRTDNKGLLESNVNRAMFYIGTAGAKVGGRGGSATNILYCLSGDSLVMRHDGVFVPIQSIKKGDTIVNGNGYKTNVFDLSKNNAEHKEFKKVYVFGAAEPVSATIDHKILVLGEKKVVWKKVQDLSLNDYVAFPLRKIRSSKKFFNVTRKKHSSLTATGKIPYSFEFGRFTGWYLAEGTSVENHTNITLSIHQKEIEKVSEICRVIAPITTTIICKKRDGNRAVVYINGRSFRHAFCKKFGLSSGKRIPYDVYKMGREFLRGLVLGYVEGDGQIKKDKITVSGIRQNLIYSWSRIVRELGYGVPGVYKQNGGIRYGRNNKDQWSAVLGGIGADMFKKDNGIAYDENPSPKKLLSRKRNQKWLIRGFGHKQWKKYAFQKIKQIQDQEIQEYMYDVVLDKKPHSFVTPIGIVSNSEAAFYQSTGKITAEEIVLATSQQVPQGKGMIFIESTGNSTDDFYYGEWERAKRKESIYQPRFFSWQEFYTPEWMEKKKLEFPSELSFKREYPADEAEAFVSAGSPYFDNLKLKIMLDKKVLPIREGKLAPDGSLI